MIGAVREWLNAIVIVTLFLSVSQTMIPEGSIRKIASFTGGLILLITLLQPLLGTDLQRLKLDYTDYERAIELRRDELEEANSARLEEIIEEQTAAYILDKAAELGLDLMVRVSAEWGAEEQDTLAVVYIEGPRSEELAAYIERELGIPQERQVWQYEN